METYVTRELDKKKNVLGECFEVYLKEDIDKVFSKLKTKLSNIDPDDRKHVIQAVNYCKRLVE